MNADKIIVHEKVQEISLTQINWNKLSAANFHDLEDKLSATHKAIKKISRLGNKRNVGTKLVILEGNTYKISERLYFRLKNMKSGKAREKLISEIISDNTPIESI